MHLAYHCVHCGHGAFGTIPHYEHNKEIFRDELPLLPSFSGRKYLLTRAKLFAHVET